MNNFNVHIFIFQDNQFKKIEISIYLCNFGRLKFYRNNCLKKIEFMNYNLFDLLF